MERRREKVVLVDYNGSLFKTIYDEDGSFFYCPICGSDKSVIFFKEEDLIHHMLTHIRGDSWIGFV